ncbi:Kynurenine formamidase [Gryganskiella cystojenkinii]|nr:Kynurenine formamidase [Gryganskiella cystojenkinii]
MSSSSSSRSKTVDKDIVYAPISEWEKHTLDLYYPLRHYEDEMAEAAGHWARSLIVFVHGGAWRTGDKSLFVQLAKDLAESTGDVVAVVNYTLSIAAIKDDPTSVPAKAQHPKHVNDVATALGFLYQRGLDTGAYNPESMYLVGHSAGGQITGLLALRPDSYLEPAEFAAGLSQGTLHRSIKGVIGVEGIYNVDKLLKVWPSYRDFVIQGFGQAPESLVRGSPDGQAVQGADAEDFVLPYYAVIQSNQDELVDAAQANEYVSHLKTVAGPAAKEDRVVVEFGDWGSHDDMLQTAQFTQTVTKYLAHWKRT